MSWWDYGYQIAGMANRTTLVDNNTWNNSHIALVSFWGCTKQFTWLFLTSRAYLLSSGRNNIFRKWEIWAKRLDWVVSMCKMNIIEVFLIIENDIALTYFNSGNSTALETFWLIILNYRISAVIEWRKRNRTAVVLLKIIKNPLLFLVRDKLSGRFIFLHRLKRYFKNL